MKAGLLAVAALSAVAVALPHRNHQALHEREAAAVVEIVTQVDVVTATAPAQYVYVDQNGNPVQEPTSAPVVHGKWGGDGQDRGHHGHSKGPAGPAVTSVAPVVPAPAPAPVTTSAPPPPPPVVESPVAPAPVVPAPVVSIPAVNPPVVSVPAVIPPVISVPAPVASSNPVSGSGDYAGLGITYSPYTSGPCRNAAQVAKDIGGLSKFSTIRLYGVDCDQITNVMAALAPNQKVMLGIFNIDGRLDGEVQSLIKQVNGRWDRVSAINVGNEAIGNGQGDAGSIGAAVSSARGTLSQHFNGPIATVDIVDHYTSGALCGTAHKDTVFANAHPFFANVAPNTSGDFVAKAIADIQKKCGVKNVIITETGWPTVSEIPSLVTNRLAIPGKSPQTEALESIGAKFPGNSNIFLFSAYNEAWKPVDAGTLGVERHWGVLGNSLNDA